MVDDDKIIESIEDITAAEIDARPKNAKKMTPFKKDVNKKQIANLYKADKDIVRP